MDWTVKQGGTFGEWEYHDENRLRAILQHRPREPSGWVVWRIGSNGKNHGCDSFRTRREAHDFITNGKVFI